MRDADISFGEPWYLDAADLVSRPDPGPVPFLVDGLIVDQALVAFVGKWKTTKSYAAIEMCVSITTGRPAFGTFAIPNPGPVVYVNEESGEAALQRRLDALCRGRAIDPEELRNSLYVAANRRVKLDDPGWQSELIATGKQLQPRLFVFDPLARMKAPERDESEQKSMGPVIEFWRELRDETGAAVALVIHTGHQGEHIRGTSDMESVWETRLHWSKSGSEVEVRGEHREWDAPAPFKYRIAWDSLTRSMRFKPVNDAFTTFVVGYLTDHPDASANEVYKAADGVGRPAKTKALEVIRGVREGGSESRNHPGTTPLEQRQGSGSPVGAFRPPGTTLTVAPLEVVPEAETARETGVSQCLICDGEIEDTDDAAPLTCAACVAKRGAA